ncbi:MAG: hypothetical protein FWC51_00890 [Proteobacteria bacterium]|nr:hypothetical protein [Pseudomonadota bacterium]
MQVKSNDFLQAYLTTQLGRDRNAYDSKSHKFQSSARDLENRIKEMGRTTPIEISKDYNLPLNGRSIEFLEKSAWALRAFLFPDTATKAVQFDFGMSQPIELNGRAKIDSVRDKMQKKLDGLYDAIIAANPELKAIRIRKESDKLHVVFGAIYNTHPEDIEEFINNGYRNKNYVEELKRLTGFTSGTFGLAPLRAEKLIASLKQQQAGK